MATNDPKISISDKRRILEILAVVATGLGKFMFMDILELRFPFIIITITGWAIYIFFQVRRTKGILKYWGFRSDNFKKVILKILPVGGIAVVTFIIAGYFLGTLNFSWHIIPILIIYPTWGIIQQYLIMGLVAGNLQDLEAQKLNKFFTIGFAAILFAIVHYPDYWLILGTFLLALFYTYIFLNDRNVYALGLFHGWIGAIFYYTLVDRDPFIEVFGKYL